MKETAENNPNAFGLRNGTSTQFPPEFGHLVFVAQTASWEIMNFLIIVHKANYLRLPTDLTVKTSNKNLKYIAFAPSQP
jgi:hypothetical protein